MTDPGSTPDGSIPSAARSRAQVGVLVVDSLGTIRHANNAAHELIGRPGRSLIGQEFGLPLGDDLQQSIEIVDSAGLVRTADMRVAPYVARGFESSGAYAVTIRPRTGAESATRAAVTARRSAADAERIAAADQKEADAADLTQRVEETLATTYHELGNTVASLSAGLTLLREAWEDMPEDDKRVRVARLDRIATGLATQLKGYLDASSVEAGVFEPRPEANDLHDVVLERLPDLGPGPAVEVDIEPGTRVMVDATHCWSIIGNLLNNARKHGAEPIRVSAGTTSDVTVIRVCDGGRGVPADRVETLFERYTHGGKSESSGLGLWIAAQLTKSYNGEIGYEYVDERSCFWVRLPARAVKLA